MKDVGTHHFVKSSAGAGSVLVPQPSDDEHDPLVNIPPIISTELDWRDSKQNWSPMWKGFAIMCATMVSFSQGFGPLALVNTPSFCLVGLRADCDPGANVRRLYRGV
jgi:hypothetical protein